MGTEIVGTNAGLLLFGPGKSLQTQRKGFDQPQKVVLHENVLTIRLFLPHFHCHFTVVEVCRDGRHGMVDSHPIQHDLFGHA